MGMHKIYIPEEQRDVYFMNSNSAEVHAISTILEVLHRYIKAEYKEDVLNRTIPLTSPQPARSPVTSHEAKP